MSEKVLIVLFDEEELTKTLIENYLKEVSFPYEVLKFNEFDETLIPSTGQKKIIIVNINKTNALALRQISKLSIYKQNLFLIISYDKSADLQVNALRTGAKEFLYKPLIQSDFVNAVMKMYKNDIFQRNDGQKPRVFSVITKEKGVGKTFFALNFAKELADASKERVLLIDFNNNLNDLSYVLNLNIRYNTPFFFNKLEEGNASVVLPRLTRYKNSSLFVMANGNLRNEETTVNEKRIPIVIEELKKYFKYIVIDNDMEQMVVNYELYKKSDEIYFVISSSLSNASIAKDYEMKAFQGKIVKYVLNKYNAKKDEAIINQLEQILGKQLTLLIPKNIVAISTAQSSCSTIKEVGENLDISQMYVKLAKSVVGK